MATSLMECRSGSDLVQGKYGTAASTSFAKSMKAIRKCSWYWGNLTWGECESILERSPPGSFLIRDSASDRYIFTLSFKTPSSAIYHTRVLQNKGVYCFGGPNSLIRTNTLEKFVERVVEVCNDNDFCVLMHAKEDLLIKGKLFLSRLLKRHEFLPSLKYLCRLVIRHTIEPSFVKSHPLPNSILAYIEDSRYLIPDTIFDENN